MSIYSFLVAVRSDGQQLMSDTGETTSHLMGMFYRTLRIVDNGVSADPNLRAYGTGSDE
jgi:flap endonuclease-1